MSMKGFTLIETMVAIAILTLSIVGPMITANRAIVAADTASDQLTASYLAQEGIEYVRAVRDNEFLAAYSTNTTTKAWNNFTFSYSAIAQCDATSNTRQACTLDPASNTLAPCTVGSTCMPLYLGQIISGVYMYTQQNVGVKTAFTRTIQMVRVTGTDDRITSTVSWSFHSIPYAVTITDHLTPWQ